MVFSSLGSAVFRQGGWLALLLLLFSACGSELTLELTVPPELSGAFSIPRENAAPAQGALGYFDGKAFSGSDSLGNREVSCKESFGLFPPSINEQSPLFRPYDQLPYTLVESCFSGNNTSFLAAARLTDSWFCQHKKHGSTPSRVALYPSETWSAITTTNTPPASLTTPRFGHRVTALPDGRVVISGGISGKTDILAQPLDQLGKQIVAATAFSSEILLLDPHATDDALRFQVLGTTSRAYHQAFWNGAKLVLSGGFTADGTSAAETWEIPPAGQTKPLSQTAVAGGNEPMRRAFGTAFALERSGKVFAEQVGGLPTACLQTKLDSSCDVAKLLPQECIAQQTPANFDTICAGIEDAIFLHQTTFLPQPAQGEAHLLLSGGFVLLKSGTPSDACTDLKNGATLCPNPYLVFLHINASGARNAHLTHLSRYSEKNKPYTLSSLFAHQALYLGKHNLQLSGNTALDTLLIVGGWSPFGHTKGPYPDLKIFGSSAFNFSHQAFLLQITDRKQAPILLPFDFKNTAGKAVLLLRSFASAAAFPTANDSDMLFGVFAGGVAQDITAIENSKSPFIRVDISREPFDSKNREPELTFPIGDAVIRLRVSEVLSPTLAQRSSAPWRSWGGAEGVRTATGAFVWFGGVFQSPSGTSTSTFPNIFLFQPGRLGSKAIAKTPCALFPSRP